MVRIDKHTTGRRVYVFNRRLHHGTTGILGTVAFASFKNYRMCVPFIYMIWHDRLDFPFRDIDNH